MLLQSSLPAKVSKPFLITMDQTSSNGIKQSHQPTMSIYNLSALGTRHTPSRYNLLIKDKVLKIGKKTNFVILIAFGRREKWYVA